MTTPIIRFLLLLIGLGFLAEAALAAPEPRVFGRSTEESYADKAVVIKVGENDLRNSENFRFMRRTLRRADSEGARAVVFDLHTPGGLALETADLMMKEMAELKVPTYAFVNNKAMSAGALIAVATDAIYMKPVSSIGAAAVVAQGGLEIPETMRKKVDSGFGAFVRSVAVAKGHNPAVVEAMMFAGRSYDFGNVKVPEGELLTLTGAEAVAEFDGKPLLAKGLVDSVEDLLQREGLTGLPVVAAKPTGFERIAWWVKVLSPLLIIVGLAAAYFELKTPGFGLGGIIAIISFTIFFFGNNLAGNLAGYELMGLFFLGVILIILEILVLPGMVAGIIGVLLVVGSLLAAMVDDIAAQDFRRGDSGLLDAISWPSISLSIGLAGALAVILVMMRFLPDLPIFRRFILTASSSPTTPADSANTPEDLLIRHTGTSVTDLRPAGKAKIGARIHSVVTRGEFVAAGSHVQVIEVGSFRTVVEKIDKEA